MDQWVQTAMHLRGLTWEQFRKLRHRDRVLMFRSFERCLKPREGDD